MKNFNKIFICATILLGILSIGFGIADRNSWQTLAGIWMLIASINMLDINNNKN
jgi:hypothetical protein